MIKNKPNIKMERLLLRPFELSDRPQVKALVGDKAIADTILNMPYSYEDGIAEEGRSTHQNKFETGEMVYPKNKKLSILPPCEKRKLKRLAIFQPAKPIYYRFKTLEPVRN